MGSRRRIGTRRGRTASRRRPRLGTRRTGTLTVGAVATCGCLRIGHGQPQIARPYPCGIGCESRPSQLFLASTATAGRRRRRIHGRGTTQGNRVRLFTPHGSRCGIGRWTPNREFGRRPRDSPRRSGHRGVEGRVGTGSCAGSGRSHLIYGWQIGWRRWERSRRPRERVPRPAGLQRWSLAHVRSGTPDPSGDLGRRKGRRLAGGACRPRRHGRIGLTCGATRPAGS